MESPSASLALPDSARSLSTAHWLRAVLRCLAHWPSLVAVAILLANDHVLKVRYPSWLTGKLSDLAGLYFAPYLFLTTGLAIVWLAQAVGGRGRPGRAALPRRAVEALATWLYLATGIAFAALKLSPTTAAPVLAVAESVLGGPLRVAADPSDLLALAVLPASYAVWKRRVGRGPWRAGGEERARPVQARLRALGQCLLLAIAALAVTATTASRLDDRVLGIAADPHDPGTLYASVVQYTCGAQPEEGWANPGLAWLYRSSDGGRTWQLAGPGGERILPDPLRAGVLYLARQDSLWRLDAPGVQAQRIWPAAGEEPRRVAGRYGLGLPVDLPAWRPGLVYLGSGDSLLHSDDGGDTWKRLRLPGEQGAEVSGLASAQSKPGLLFVARGQELLRSEDGGESWSPAGTLGAAPEVLRVAPWDASLLFAGTEQGLLRSTDGGLSWRPALAPEVQGRVWAILFDPHSEGTVYTVVRGHGLLGTRDAGQTWSRLSGQELYDVAVTAPPDHRLYVSGLDSRGFEGVFRQRDPLHWPWLGGWQAASVGLPSAPPLLLDRSANLVSWLALLIALAVLLRWAAPLRLRRLAVERAWQVALLFWVPVPVALVIGAFRAPAVAADAYTFELAAAATAAAAILAAQAPVDWATWGLAAVPTLLSAVAVAVSGDRSWYAILPALAGVVALVGSARFVARHQERAARRGLVLALLLAPAYWLVYWLIEVGVSVAARAWPGCLG